MIVVVKKVSEWPSFSRCTPTVRPKQGGATGRVVAALLVAFAQGNRLPQLHPHVLQISLGLHDLRARAAGTTNKRRQLF